MAVLTGLTLFSDTTGRPNIRRAVAHAFPTGSAEITGLLSRLEPEETNQQDFYWYEDRHPSYATTLANISSTVVFCDTASPYAPLSANVTSFGDGDTLGINVANKDYYNLGDVLQYVVLEDTSGDEKLINLTITAIPDTAGRLIGVVHTRESDFTLDYDAANSGAAVELTGNARGEGTRTGEEGIFREPLKLDNLTQIFKTRYGVTGSNLKSAQDYDGSGVLDEVFWQNGLKHSVSIEKALIWGEKSQKSYADPVSGTTRRVNHMGGIIEYLKEWEKVDSDYRGGTGAPAITSDDDYNKRIIENAAGTLTPDQLDYHGERLWSKTNNMTNSKVAFGGSTAFRILNNTIRSEGFTTFNIGASDGEKDKFGAYYRGYDSPFGALYFKTHPLFNQNDEWRKWMLFLDLGNIKWRYLTDRDTFLQKNVQANDADQREDQFVTEAGIEFLYPESHMLVKNIDTVA